MVEEPPPSRFRTSSAPSPIMVSAISSQVIPTLSEGCRPSTTIHRSRCASSSQPRAVRGFRLNMCEGSEGVTFSPPCTIRGLPETTSLIHIPGGSTTMEGTDRIQRFSSPKAANPSDAPSAVSVHRSPWPTARPEVP
jgi:hypothetical protein